MMALLPVWLRLGINILCREFNFKYKATFDLLPLALLKLHMWLFYHLNTPCRQTDHSFLNKAILYIV